MSDRNVTRPQAGALHLIETVAHGRHVSPVDRELLWDAHGRLLAELERLNGMLEIAAERDRALTSEVDALNALPCVERCREERAAGNGGCGACALCCKEARDEAESLACSLAVQSETTDKWHRQADEWRDAKAQEEAAHRTEINDAIRERDDARDEAAMLGDLAMALANTTASGHAVASPLHIAEPVESCAVCILLERARRWAR